MCIAQYGTGVILNDDDYDKEKTLRHTLQQNIRPIHQKIALIAWVSFMGVLFCLIIYNKT